MDSVFSGFVLDPEKCSQLSLEEKRELVRGIAQWSKDAPEILSSFKRRELLEIICAEMGKERKYSGYNKLQMIEHLLKLITQKSKRNNEEKFLAFSPANTQTGFKRQKRKEDPLQLPNNLNGVPLESEEHVKILLCQNLACRARLSPGDAFCKRCSCCICHYYDDNKDPSLWLTCSSSCPDKDDSCGLSCHLECALKHDRTGIMKNGSNSKLDGSYYCVSCGKINGLMRTWRKQLVVAKEARRVDVLCLRISLSDKILKGTEQYKELQKTIETAVMILKNEVGPPDQVCTKMARGIVNRLSCCAEIQKLCTSALEAFDSMFPDPYPDYMNQKGPATFQIRVEESSPASVFIVLEYDEHSLQDFLGCRLWHRKSTVKDYPDKPTFIVLRPKKRFKITYLSPSTEYCCKVTLFSSTRILGTSEAKWVTPASTAICISSSNEHGKKENPVMAQTHSQMESSNSSDHLAKLQALDDDVKDKNEGLHFLPPFTQAVFLTSHTSIPPSTPCQSNEMREVPGLDCRKRPAEGHYEYSVRVVKWLERKGHIDEDFRVKFLTWFSLKATMQERRVVNVFVDALIDDPPSLAEQLIHTFNDEIGCEQKPVPRRGFCIRLWH